MIIRVCYHIIMKKEFPKPTWLLKAYDNAEFLKSSSARLVRILAEMLEPAERFEKHNIDNTVVFLGSARTLPKKEAEKKLKKVKSQVKKTKKPSKSLKDKLASAERDLLMSQYYEDAVKLSKKLTLWFKRLKKQGHNFVVCSGGGPGIMAASNQGAWEAKGKSIGMNISLPMEQHPNPFQSKELAFEFHYFFVRKFWFIYLAKALVVFPGGYGTLDEFFESLTLVQTHKSKENLPMVFYGPKYWEKILNLEEMAKWGTISKKDLKLFKICSTVDEAFNYLKNEITKYYL